MPTHRGLARTHPARHRAHRLTQALALAALAFLSAGCLSGEPPPAPPGEATPPGGRAAPPSENAIGLTGSSAGPSQSVASGQETAPAPAKGSAPEGGEAARPELTPVESASARSASAEPAPQDAAPEAATAEEAEPGPVQVLLDPPAVQQGRWTMVRVLGAPGPVSGTLEEVGPLQFFHKGEEWRALAAVPAAAAPGSRTVTLQWPDGEWTGALEVESYPFPEDRITVTAEKAATLDNPRAAEEALLLRKLRSQGNGPPRWQGPFSLPLAMDPLRVTTQFGEIRYVNGRRTGQHTGLDFGADQGTPVLAPAAGRVVLARELVITGNTVLLDHGGNLFSLYGHLSALAVREGQQVRRGQTLGAVGSTGLSTGPHLHWSVYVGNTPTDPWQTLQGLPRPLPPGVGPQ